MPTKSLLLFSQTFQMKSKDNIDHLFELCQINIFRLILFCIFKVNDLIRVIYVSGSS